MEYVPFNVHTIRFDEMICMFGVRYLLLIELRTHPQSMKLPRQCRRTQNTISSAIIIINEERAKQFKIRELSFRAHTPAKLRKPGSPVAV